MFLPPELHPLRHPALKYLRETEAPLGAAHQSRPLSLRMRRGHPAPQGASLWGSAGGSRHCPRAAPPLPELHGPADIEPGFLKVACVSFPGECAKGKGKSLFSTQDPLFELFLESQFVKDWPSLPPRDSRGQCSLNLQGEDETAAGHPACSAQFMPKAQSLGLLPSCPEALGTEKGRGHRKGEQSQAEPGSCYVCPKAAAQRAEQKRQIPRTFFHSILRRDCRDRIQTRYLLGKEK